MLLRPEIEAIKSFYCLAMFNGFATNGVYEDTVNHGEKRYTYGGEGDHSGLTLTDTYTTTINYSYGRTVITRGYSYIWHMSYDGGYLDSAIPFLKQALAKALYAGRFHGGRGAPWALLQDEEVQVIYQNEWQGDFSLFRGEEKINTPKGARLGFHRYHGMILAPHVVI